MRRLPYVWLAALCAALAPLGACDPLDACDSNQYYRNGSCRICPQDSVSTGTGCDCIDSDKEFIDGTCRDPEGQEPGPDAAVGDEDGGAEPDAGRGGAEAACGAYCGFLKGCIADNDLAAQLVQDVIEDVGIAGDDTSGCEAACVPDGADTDNAEALACFANMAEGASCTTDDSFDGVDEAVSILNACCTEHGASGVCTRLCASIAMNDTAAGLVTACP